MVRSMEETAAERRAYVNQIRASFQNPAQNMSANTIATTRRQEQITEEQEETISPGFSSLGFRTIIAILLFAAFVYCDQEKITFQKYETKDVISQIEWNPLPLEDWKSLMKYLP